MAINVNDGTAKWQLIKYSEADTLGGLTANDIKSQAITGKVIQLKGTNGNFNMSYKNESSVTYTIPLPSGFSRSQCAYIITEENIADDNNHYIKTTMNSVNQSTGVVTASISGGTRYSPTKTINVRYVVVSSK